jgi:hypothetical protein
VPGPDAVRPPADELRQYAASDIDALSVTDDMESNADSSSVVVEGTDCGMKKFPPSFQEVFFPIIQGAFTCFVLKTKLYSCNNKTIKPLLYVF